MPLSNPARILCFSAVALPLCVLDIRYATPPVFDPAAPTPEDCRGKKTLVAVFAGNEGRIEKGLELYFSGAAAEVLISGPGNLSEISEALTRVKPPAFFSLSGIYHDNAIDTAANAANMTAWVKKQINQVCRTVIVTSDFHMPRATFLALWEFEKAGIAVPLSIWPAANDFKDWQSGLVTEVYESLKKALSLVGITSRHERQAPEIPQPFDPSGLIAGPSIQGGPG